MEAIVLKITCVICFANQLTLDTFLFINEENYNNKFTIYGAYEATKNDNIIDYLPNVSLQYFPIINSYGFNVRVNLTGVVKRLKMNTERTKKLYFGKLKIKEARLFNRNKIINKYMKIKEMIKLYRSNNSIRKMKQKRLLEKINAKSTAPQDVMIAIENNAQYKTNDLKEIIKIKEEITSLTNLIPNLTIQIDD